MPRLFNRFFMVFALILAAGPARAETAPKPDFSVYQGQHLKLQLADVISQINALPPIAYVDSQTTNDFTEAPVLDVEKISVTATGGHIEFWSNDSLDGMAMESSFDVQWAQVCCGNVFVVNDPEHGVDYQVEALNGGGNFIISNAFRNVDDAGHLAPLQQGDPDNMFTFDNAGDLAKAAHEADLLTTLIDLAMAAPAATRHPAGAAAPAPVVAIGPQKPAAALAAGATVTPYMHPAGSYFEGAFAIRYTPQQDGSTAVNVINVSSKTVNVLVSVTNCQNVTGADCGKKFAGRLAPGMSLNFPVAGNDTTLPWDFHIDTAQKGV